MAYGRDETRGEVMEEAYEAFLAREEADDWRERSIEEGRIIGNLNSETNNLNETLSKVAAVVENMHCYGCWWEGRGEAEPTLIIPENCMCAKHQLAAILKASTAQIERAVSHRTKE